MYSKESPFTTTTIRIFNMKQRTLDKNLLNANSVYMKTLTSSMGKIVFSRPVFFTITHNEGGHYAYCKELNVYAYGVNEITLRDDICKEIVDQWGMYANEAAENMTRDALRAKENLRELVVLKESTIQHA